MEGKKPHNTSFFFIPLRFRDVGRYHDLTKALTESGAWDREKDQLRYLMRYVSDKLKDQCSHFTLAPEAFEKASLPPAGTLFQTRFVQSAAGRTRYAFTLDRIHLFCFETSVCVMAFQITYAESDSVYVANAEFCLKNVSREPFYEEGEPLARKGGRRFLYVAKNLLAFLEEDFGLDYFFYVSPGTERASFLTLLETKDLEDHVRDLFFLRRGYSDGYNFESYPEIEKEEIFSLNRGTVWGVSAEGAACLFCRAYDSKNFYDNVFIPNFRTQYLYMYVLLLHQKYVLYMFLTDMGPGRRNDLETLVDYQKRLHEFETDFVFSFVSEVPQYQTLYERVRKAFALESMYQDINDPLVTLKEERENEAAAAQDKFMTFLTLLTLISVMTDGFALIGDALTILRGDPGPGPGMLLIHLIQFIYLGAIAVFVLMYRRTGRKKGAGKKG